MDVKDNQIVSINVELTNSCPLRCPQCYCHLEGGKHIDPEVAKARIREAADHGAITVSLSGGETLCYPYLYELIEYAAGKVENVNVALSGWHFDSEVLKKLVDAGVTGICISLNGSTEEINALTRDGYQYAINGLQVLSENHFPNSYINWVMHSNNTDDFPNIVALAEKYNIQTVDIIMFKPDAKDCLSSYPSGEQMKQISDFIHAYHGKVDIVPEACFSPLRALVYNYGWIGNLNSGPTRGCGAGIYIYSVNTEGHYSPCRHLDYYEDFSSLDEYLEKSELIQKIRHFEEDLREPCSGCSLQKYCRPCIAITDKMYGGIYKGHEPCTAWKLNEYVLR